MNVKWILSIALISHGLSAMAQSKDPCGSNELKAQGPYTSVFTLNDANAYLLKAVERIKAANLDAIKRMRELKLTEDLGEDQVSSFDFNPDYFNERNEIKFEDLSRDEVESIKTIFRNIGNQDDTFFCRNGAYYLKGRAFEEGELVAKKDYSSYYKTGEFVIPSSDGPYSNELDFRDFHSNSENHAYKVLDRLKELSKFSWKAREILKIRKIKFYSLIDHPLSS